MKRSTKDSLVKLIIYCVLRPIQAQSLGHGDTFVPSSQVINVANFADHLPNPANILLISGPQL